MKIIVSILNNAKRYIDIKRCRVAAQKVKKEKIYANIPAINGLVNEIIEKPEKHYKGFLKYDDMEEYIEYVVWTNQSVS